VAEPARRHAEARGQSAMSTPIPAHVITGSLGAGKTTVIARLLADKPPQEDWVVLLNEFSDAGIDALTVASAARGAYDVRLVPGGCLCCAGEQDFRRNLQELVTTRRPARILIEPSGLGHPAGIVEELLAYQSSGSLRLAGVLALVDPRRLGDGSLEPGTDAWAQVEIADALALSKADLATSDDRARFAALVAALYPAKSWSGTLEGGEVPWAALESGGPRAASAIARPELHSHERASPGHARRDAADAEHDAGAHQQGPVPHECAAANGLRRSVTHIGHRATRWVFPRSIEFSEARLVQALTRATGGARAGAAAVARLKGVFRVGEDDWVLLQSDGHGVDLRPTSWRRDSRVELLAPADLPPAEAEAEVAAWDGAWSQAQLR